MTNAFADQLHLTRRQLLATGLGATAAAALYATEGERHWLSVERKTVNIARLPAAFQGFTIAQISDIHFHRFDEEFFLRHVVRTVNSLGVDMVALTGDYITGLGRTAAQIPVDMEGCASMLADLLCPIRICVMGNHDLFDRDMVIGKLRKHGLEVLNNSFRAIERGGARLWISGIADAFYDQPDLEKALPKRADDEPIVLLGHEPDFADALRLEHRVDLMLTGHTHGGQVRLQFITQQFLPDMGRKYVEGLFSLRSGTQLYVNRGIGTMHLPVRLFCRPEVTLFTLKLA